MLFNFIGTPRMSKVHFTLSPTQMVSQVHKSGKLESTGDYVTSGLTFTFAKIKFAPKFSA